MRQIVWALAALWVGACDIPPEVRSQIACTTICTCISGALDPDSCIAECIEEADFTQIPDDCFECIQTHANQCSTLEQDCEPLCDRPMPDPPNGFPDAGMPPPSFPDAGVSQ